MKQYLLRGYLAAFVPSGRGLRSVTAAVVLPTRGHDVFLPGVKVCLEPAGGGPKATPVVTTDLSGRFTFFVRGQTRYRLCWDSDVYGKGCGEPFTTTDRHQNLSTVRIPIKPDNGYPAIWGTVRMADGSMPRFLEPLANVNSFAKVELLNEDRKPVQRVYVNNFGEYLLPRVPAKKAVVLRTIMEASRRDWLIRPQYPLAERAFHAFNLTVGNIKPTIEPIVAMRGDTRAKVAAPGEKVRLAARVSDPDGDPIRIRWEVTPGGGTLSSSGGDSIQWALPAKTGHYEVTAVAYDGRGGYSRSRLQLPVTRDGIAFSGHVRATGGGAVTEAEVEINGTRMLTRNDGFFRLYVGDAQRFVLNIRKKGYAFYSKIYDRGVIGGTWTLTRATVINVDPAKPIDVVNDRRPSDCPGPEFLRARWEQFPAAAKPVYQDLKGRPIRRAELAKLSGCDIPKLPTGRPGSTQGGKPGCGPGARVRIPANALVDSRGRAPAGNVDVSISTVDLYSPEQMPGDYTVRMTGEATQVMQSYGAAIIEITGSGGERYNLRAGTTASIVLPVDPSQLAAGGPLPPSIPVLFYDERDGVWLPEGNATLVGTEYRMDVKHFSAVNCDTLKINQSCVRVLSPGMPANFNIEVTVPQGGGAAPKIIPGTINNASPSEHVLYNLPVNENIVVVAIQSGVPIGTYIVNTGDTQDPTTPNKPAGPPYVACKSTLVMTPQSYPDVPETGEFLHGLYSFEATNLDELDEGDPNDPNDSIKDELNNASTAYYHEIDPRDKRLNLFKFKETNGFGGPDEIHAVYANGGDLGFGRDMHCVKKVSGDVACYVTNFGKYSTDDNQDVQDIVDFLTPGPPDPAPVATVAMEYSPIESDPPDPTEIDDPTPHVKFYVFLDDGLTDIGTTNTRANAANLDDLGARPIPQLCMVCHNGYYPAYPPPATPSPGEIPLFNSRDSVKLSARFLPFDLFYYVFAAAPFDQTSQEDEFKALNEQIVAATNPGTATTDLIAAWYNGSATQLPNALVTGWDTTNIDRGMYRNVVARTCRTCHVAQQVDALQFKTTTEATDRLGSIESRVCIQHVMPHARRTHDIFWQSLSPHMPGILQIFGDYYDVNGWNGTFCGAYTPPTPPGQWDLIVQPILNNYGCGGCHYNPDSFTGITMDLNPGLAFASSVNVISEQAAPMPRITPFQPENSYLMHKLDGTQGSVPGGTGSQMPDGCGGNSCLSQAERDAIRQYILDGAPP